MLRHACIRVFCLLMLAGPTGAIAASDPCGGAHSSVGETLRGPILHVTDGRLCVAVSAARWVPVHVTPASAAGAKRDRLMTAAFAKNAVCTITQIDGDRANAACRIEGRPLVDLLQDTVLVKASQVWR